MLPPSVRLILYAVFFGVWTLRATVGYTIDEAIEAGPLRTIYATNVKALLWFLPAFYLANRYGPDLRHKSLGMLPWPTRVQWFSSGLAIIGFLALLSLLEGLAGQKHWSVQAFLPSVALVTIWQLVLSPMIEELLFRGFLLPDALQRWPTWWAVLSNSLFFVIIHWPYWIWSGRDVAAIARDSVGILVFSLFAGWLLVRTRSVWPPVVAHIANNTLATLLVA